MNSYETFGEMCDQARARGHAEGFAAGKREGYDEGWQEAEAEQAEIIAGLKEQIEDMKNKVAVAEVGRGMAEKQLENFRKDLVRQLGGTFKK